MAVIERDQAHPFTHDTLNGLGLDTLNGLGLPPPSGFLKPFLKVLLANDRHNLDGFPCYSIVNAVRATHTTPVPHLNVIYGWVQKRLFCKLIETVKQRCIIFICGSFAMGFKPIAINTASVGLGVCGQSIISHQPAVVH